MKIPKGLRRHRRVRPVAIAKLHETQLVAVDGDNLRLTTEQCQCAILADGRYVAAENKSGRLTRWLPQLKKE
jgi:hypothetical protein